MKKPVDDLDAVRQVATILEHFSETERTRIIRWSLEKLGQAATSHLPLTGAPAVQSSASTNAAGEAADIKTFVDSKRPRTALQLAATVAYYYRFHAPEADRKDAIKAADLLTACRLTDRKRPARATQTMVDAYDSGLFDKAGTGSYRLNSVGENLVAMVLPGAAAANASKAAKTRKAAKPNPRNKAR